MGVTFRLKGFLVRQYNTDIDTKEQTMARFYTNMLLEMVDDNILDRDHVIMACLKYMSEDDVRDMMECNEFIDVEDEDDGQPDEAQEWADFDADC
jgi:hypothetical protein